MVNGVTADGRTRFAALDYLRGFAVAGMIVVTSPGDWNHTFGPLLHAEWNGWTLTDMVFPTFLFAVGIAVGLSFPLKLATADDNKRFWFRVLRRVLALIVLGLALNAVYTLAIDAGAWFPGKAGWGNMRLTGVPQRIALCYLLAMGLTVLTGRRRQDGRLEMNHAAIMMTIILTLVVYWALLMFVPVPGYGAGHLEPAGNLPGTIDQMLITPPHMWPLGSATWGGPVTYDPEGLLSTLPATTNVLFGLLATRLLRAAPDKVLWIAVAGAVLFAFGMALDPLFVINKRLWTSSFAILSSGFSMMALAVFLRAKGPLAQRWLTPLTVLGGNAITAFSVSILLGYVYSFPFFGSGDHRLSPQNIMYNALVPLMPDPRMASLICALGMLALITAMIWPLHRKGLHLRL